MPTYYLMKSGYLEKRGIKTEDFAVPSGNLTMQQMVARQVDMGTYAGPSFIIGHDKGGLVAIAQIETVGATGAMVVRKDLGITKMAELKGKKIANQTGSSIGNIFVDQVGPANGLKKGDFQEVRMDVNNMIAAHGGQDRGRHDQRRALQRHRRGRRASAPSSWTCRNTTRCRCSWRRRPISSRRTRTPSSPISRPGSTSRSDFKENPKKVSDVIYSFFTSKGYKMTPKTFATAMGRVEVDPGFPTDLVPYLTQHAEVLLQEKKISSDAGLEEGAADRLHGKGAGLVRRKLRDDRPHVMAGLVPAMTLD